MEKIKDAESKILTMRIYDPEAKSKLSAEKGLTKEQIQKLNKEQIEDVKKEIRLEKLDTYQKYQRFKKMINVYNRYEHTKNFTNILKVTDPTLVLDKLYRDEGLDKEPNIDEEFIIFKKTIDEAKQENPNLDLSDITSQDSRSVMSDIINQTQKGREMLPADLDFVAVIEGFGLYAAMTEIRAGKNKETVKKKYDITEEMLQKGETRLQDFNKKEISDTYRRIKVNETVLIAAGALEIAPGEAQRDLESFGKIESKEKDEITEECLLIKRKEPQLYVIDAFYNRLKEGAPTKQDIEMVQESVDNYLNGIEEWNKEQEAEEKKYRRANNGKPSPRFLRELKEYQEEKAKEQGQVQVENHKMVVGNER